MAPVSEQAQDAMTDAKHVQPQYYRYLVVLSCEARGARGASVPQNELQCMRLTLVDAVGKEVVEKLVVDVQKEGGFEKAIGCVDGFLADRRLKFPSFVFVTENRWDLDVCLKWEAACKQVRLQPHHWCYFMDLRVELAKFGVVTTDIRKTLAALDADGGSPDDADADADAAALAKKPTVDVMTDIVLQLLEKDHVFKSPYVVSNQLLSTIQRLWMEGGVERDATAQALREQSVINVTGIPESHRSTVTVEKATEFMKPLFIPSDRVFIKPKTDSISSVQICYVMPDADSWRTALAFYTRTWGDMSEGIDVLPATLRDALEHGWPDSLPRSATPSERDPVEERIAIAEADEAAAGGAYPSTSYQQHVEVMPDAGVPTPGYASPAPMGAPRASRYRAAPYASTAAYGVGGNPYVVPPQMGEMGTAGTVPMASYPTRPRPHPRAPHHPTSASASAAMHAAYAVPPQLTTPQGMAMRAPPPAAGMHSDAGPATTHHFSRNIVIVRKLPYQTNELDIAQFFDGIEISPQGVHLLFTADMRPRGEAFVELCSRKDVQLALQRNRTKLGHRYVDVLPSSNEELTRTVKRSVFLAPPLEELPEVAQQFHLPEHFMYRSKFQAPSWYVSHHGYGGYTGGGAYPPPPPPSATKYASYMNTFPPRYDVTPAIGGSDSSS